MRLVAHLGCILLLAGCASTFTAWRSNDESTLHDLRMEIADLKHALHGTDVEVKLLEERMENTEGTLASVPKDNGAISLERRLIALEKTVEKIATQTAASLATYRQQIALIDGKLDEISKLRSTLSALSKTAPSTSYQVKAGDSLEKIARKFQVSVEALKRENHLSTDKIVVGQELAIPSF